MDRVGRSSTLTSQYYDDPASISSHPKLRTVTVRNKDWIETPGQRYIVAMNDHDVLDPVRELGASTAPRMIEAIARARSLAACTGPVLVAGELGSGKQLVARAIHAWGPRPHASFVVVSCTSRSLDLASALDAARGGTLFLEGTGLLRSDQQEALLPLLRDPPEARVIASTPEDLLEAVHAGSFRMDLYERLAGDALHVPPLRDRAEDIPGIAERWLSRRAWQTGRGPWALPAPTIAALGAARWEGNVSQLINALERATFLVRAGPIDARHLGLASALGSPRGPLPTFEAHERRYLEALLAQTDGRIYGPQGAAAAAGLKPTTLHSKLKKHGLR